ncbi:S1C family serine protease [Serinibacter salmoneus]|uniref:Putative serine protease PepD n=1 Tax=Serinibacter salmoneus TaxID=556530 RepID=A0A2A9CZI9_9MICO|nr:trypsin-like peptidase domain-containing protein [Serinibacter salmoneus]PFG19112.1 putative serine protease PepD [Serinibacter salmoneus]
MVESYARTRPRRRGVAGGTVAVIAVLALLVGMSAGLALAPWFGIETTSSGQSSSSPSDPQGASQPDPPESGSVPQTLLQPDLEEDSLYDVASIAATALPSTVSIEVTGASFAASGSGFVLREDGYILTNAHVVAGSEGADLVVVFSDGEQFPATIVGETVDYDLAVLKVEREGLTPLVLGDSDEVVVGQPVVAVGAPLGLQGTVTTGIVSALNRPVLAGDLTQTSFINAIQTDAAINPGNSGGPLLNRSGEVIGINSAIAQASTQEASGSIGLGFAIPSNQARRTAEQLIADGFATYPVIGVLLDSSYTGVGVKVVDAEVDGVAPVTPGGAAEAAGIAAGDVIVAINGVPVTVSDELIVAIRAHAPGETITLTVRESSGDRDIQVVLGEARSQ